MNRTKTAIKSKPTPKKAAKKKAPPRVTKETLAVQVEKLTTAQESNKGQMEAAAAHIAELTDKLKATEERHLKEVQYQRRCHEERVNRIIAELNETTAEFNGYRRALVDVIQTQEEAMHGVIPSQVELASPMKAEPVALDDQHFGRLIREEMERRANNIKEAAERA